MDWKLILPIVGAVAPAAGSLLGTAFGGPLGGMLGGKIGGFLAEALGVPPTPVAVSDALGAAKEETARAAINAALERARAELQAFVDIEKAWTEAMVRNTVAVNQTMQVEAAHPSLFFTGWRPAIGWTFEVVASCFGALLIAATFKTLINNPDPLTVLRDAWPLYATYFGALAAMVGVLINGRSSEKVAAITAGVVPGTTVKTVTTPVATTPVSPIARVFPRAPPIGQVTTPVTNDPGRLS